MPPGTPARGPSPYDPASTRASARPGAGSAGPGAAPPSARPTLARTVPADPHRTWAAFRPRRATMPPSRSRSRRSPPPSAPLSAGGPPARRSGAVTTTVSVALPVAPPASRTATVTVYDPAAANVCVTCDPLGLAAVAEAPRVRQRVAVGIGARGREADGERRGPAGRVGGHQDRRRLVGRGRVATSPGRSCTGSATTRTSCATPTRSRPTPATASRRATPRRTPSTNAGSARPTRSTSTT